MEMDAMKVEFIQNFLNETDNKERESFATDEYLTSGEFWDTSSNRLNTIC
jgi:hypothetical protein